MDSSDLVQLKDKIQKGEWNEILNSLCFIKENEIVLDYLYFKHFAGGTTYNYIIANIIQNIDTHLTDNEQFIMRINMRSLSVSDFDKHKHFIQEISLFFKQKYDGKLFKCYIHNAPFIFSQVFNLISKFIDKETQEKIIIVDRQK